MSISIIGWAMVASGLFALPLAFLHVPLSLFGMMLEGGSAIAGILLIALAYLLIGIGLLQLKPEARIAGIALFLLFGLNGLVISFLPDTHARMLGAMRATPFITQPANRPSQALPPIFRLLRIPIIGVVLGVPLWILITRKRAFEPSATRASETASK